MGADGWPTGWRGWRGRNGEPLDIMTGDWFGVDAESEEEGDRCATPDKDDVIPPIGQGEVTRPVLGANPAASETPIDRRANNGRRRGRQNADAFDWIAANEIDAGENFAPQFSPLRARQRREPMLADDEATYADMMADAAGSDLRLGGVAALAAASAGRPGSELHRGLALADKRVLHMVNAMASFDAQPASDLARSARQRDPRVAAMLTSLPDMR
jgi:hypothetical protein